MSSTHRERVGGKRLSRGAVVFDGKLIFVLLAVVMTLIVSCGTSYQDSTIVPAITEDIDTFFLDVNYSVLINVESYGGKNFGVLLDNLRARIRILISNEAIAINAEDLLNTINDGSFADHVIDQINLGVEENGASVRSMVISIRKNG